MSIVYKIVGSVEAVGMTRPQTTRISKGHILGTFLDVHGHTEDIDPDDWKEPPHFALANLPTFDKQGKVTMKPELELGIDEKALQRFIRTYGVLRSISQELVDYGIEHFMEACSYEFDQEIAEVVELQNLLRRAWMGDSGPTHSYRGEKAHSFGKKIHFGSPFAIFDKEVTLNAFELVYDQPGTSRLQTEFWKPDHKYEKILLVTSDLWKFICYSMLRDFSAGKTGVCGNPDCAAPYYLKRRRDQKFCQSGCTEYAQRQYSLNWWRKNKQEKRAKKGTKSPRRKRQ